MSVSSQWTAHGNHATSRRQSCQTRWVLRLLMGSSHCVTRSAWGEPVDLLMEVTPPQRANQVELMETPDFDVLLPLRVATCLGSESELLPLGLCGGAEMLEGIVEEVLARHTHSYSRISDFLKMGFQRSGIGNAGKTSSLTRFTPSRCISTFRRKPHPTLKVRSAPQGTATNSSRVFNNWGVSFLSSCSEVARASPKQGGGNKTLRNPRFGTTKQVRHRPQSGKASEQARTDTPVLLEPSRLQQTLGGNPLWVFRDLKSQGKVDADAWETSSLTYWTSSKGSPRPPPSNKQDSALEAGRPKRKETEKGKPKQLTARLLVFC